jgi:hypothetical protein
MAVNAWEIRDKAVAFVAGKLSLRQFEDWFVPGTWDQHQVDDPEAESLADSIELSISEYTDGLSSDAQLRQEIAEAIRPCEPKADLSYVFYEPRSGRTSHQHGWAVGGAIAAAEVTRENRWLRPASCPLKSVQTETTSASIHRLHRCAV